VIVMLSYRGYRRFAPVLACLTLCTGLSTSTAAEASPLDAATRTLEQVTSQTARPFSTRDFGREQYPQARSVLVPERDAEKLLRELRSRLANGIMAFVGVTNSHADPAPEGVELVVAQGSSQFDILRVAASDGINHGLETEDLVRELQAWDEEFGIDIWQAESDTIQVRLKALPKDMKGFAERVYRFCPDVVDQGTGNVRALQNEIQRTKAVFLWWD
jgi:hypothetical protein